MAQMKARASAITEIHCSNVVEMSTNNSGIIHLGLVLVNSAVCHNCGKTLENGLRSHRQTWRVN